MGLGLVIVLVVKLVNYSLIILSALPIVTSADLLIRLSLVAPTCQTCNVNVIHVIHANSCLLEPVYTGTRTCTRVYV